MMRIWWCKAIVALLQLTDAVVRCSCRLQLCNAANLPIIIQKIFAHFSLFADRNVLRQREDCVTRFSPSNSYKQAKKCRKDFRILKKLHGVWRTACRLHQKKNIKHVFIWMPLNKTKTKQMSFKKISRSEMLYTSIILGGFMV